MVLPKNAVQFSTFFKYALSLVTVHKSSRLSVALLCGHKFQRSESGKITQFDLMPNPRHLQIKATAMFYRK